MKEFTIPTIKDIAAELHYEVEILRPNEQNPAFERATLAAQVAVLAELFNQAVEQRENDLAELQRGFNNRTQEYRDALGRVVDQERLIQKLKQDAADRIDQLQNEKDRAKVAELKLAAATNEIKGLQARIKELTEQPIKTEESGTPGC